MEKTIGFILLLSISLIDGYYYNSNYGKCAQLENKFFRMTVSFPNRTSIHLISMFRSNGMLDTISNAANGNNVDEVGIDLRFADSIGVYQCPQGSTMRFTAIGYAYKSNLVPFLQENGAIVIYDTLIRFSNKNRYFKGVTRSAFYSQGQNPFTTSEEPLAETDLGEVTGEILDVRTLNKLSGI